MSKVDLPYFLIDVSMNLTRFRFDVSAHVNAIDQEAIAMSYEQGSPPKGRSELIESILIDHILRCRGEGIKIVVADNASVGKLWATCICLPK